jgi:iron complex transport system substrate-binding protein
VKIVSLLPSATEAVWALGLGPDLHAVSHECDYPAPVAALPKITRAHMPPGLSSREIDDWVRDHLKSGRSLYSLDLDLLGRIKPDLMITQTLCEVCAIPERQVLDAACGLGGSPRVLNVEPTTLDEVIATVGTIAEAAGRPEAGRALMAALRARIAAVAARAAKIAKRKRAIFLEWLDPPYASGHWIPDIVRLAGADDPLGRAGARSRVASWSEVVAADPDVLVVALCGFDLARSIADAPKLLAAPGIAGLRAVRAGEVYFGGGSEHFIRPGPRLVESLEVLAATLYPDVHPLPEGLARLTRLAPNAR